MRGEGVGGGGEGERETRTKIREGCMKAECWGR